MGELRRFNRGQSKLSAGDRDVLSRFRSDRQQMVDDFNAALKNMGDELAKRHAEAMDAIAKAKQESEDRLQHEIAEAYIFIVSEDDRVEEMTCRTISYRIVAMWRAVVHFFFDLKAQVTK